MVEGGATHVGIGRSQVTEVLVGGPARLPGLGQALVAQPEATRGIAHRFSIRWTRSPRPGHVLEANLVLQVVEVEEGVLQQSQVAAPVPFGIITQHRRDTRVPPPDR